MVAHSGPSVPHGNVSGSHSVPAHAAPKMMMMGGARKHRKTARTTRKVRKSHRRSQKQKQQQKQQQKQKQKQ